MSSERQFRAGRPPRLWLWAARVMAVSLGVMMVFLIELGSVPRPVLADGEGSPGICLDPTGNHGGGGIKGSVSGTPDLVTYSVPEGAYVSGVCIKSGAKTFGGIGHSTRVLGNGIYDHEGKLLPHGVPGCFAVSGVSLREGNCSPNKSVKRLPGHQPHRCPLV
jgi:hypothetical protein